MKNHNIAAWLFVFKDLEPEPHKATTDSQLDLDRFKLLLKGNPYTHTIEDLSSFYHTGGYKTLHSKWNTVKNT